MQASATRGASSAQPVRLSVMGEVAAGQVPDRALGPGEALRIMTGAPLPRGADAVVRCEVAREEGGKVAISAPVLPGADVRRAGQDFAPGDKVFPRGLRLHSHAIGTMAMLGRAQVPAVERPRVAVLATGDELRDLGEPASATHPVVASNLYMLEGQVREAGGIPLRMGIGHDSEEELVVRLAEALRADVVVTTAGTGQGSRDLLRRVCQRLGAEILIDGVAIRPGSSTLVVHREGRWIFCLPGGPGSAWSAFHALVRPLLYRMQEAAPPSPIPAIAGEPIQTSRDLTHIVRGRLTREGGEVRFLRSTTVIDGVALIPGDGRSVEVGDRIEVDLLPYSLP